MSKVIWVYVNSNNRKEAELIGGTLLKERLCACYGLYPKLKSVYFWPPLSRKLEQSTGPLIVLETLPRKFRQLAKRVRQLHSDRVPFIGYAEIKGIQEDFYAWMENEV